MLFRENPILILHNMFKITIHKLITLSKDERPRRLRR
jgi:hypothetical protein